ncbi:MAG: hypothetical protein KGI04_03195 [Candidatus Micrarchaeota archaeon]|nr:hypothetical protein [Candidatus Micrarchaeota archaeon]
MTFVYGVRPKPLSNSAKEEKKLIDAFAKDVRWLEAHRKELKKKYDDDFIAIKGEKVIAHNFRLSKLVEKLRAIGEAPENLLIDSAYRPKLIMGLQKEPWKRKLLLDIRLQGESEIEEIVTGSPGKWEFTPAGEKYLLEGKPLANSRRR